MTDKMIFLTIEKGQLVAKETVPQDTPEGYTERELSLTVLRTFEEYSAYAERNRGTRILASSKLDFAHEYTKDPDTIALCRRLRMDPDPQPAPTAPHAAGNQAGTTHTGETNKAAPRPASGAPRPAPTNTLDRKDLWAWACRYAVGVGIRHALNSQRPMTAADLTASLRRELGGRCIVRNGHTKALRRAYGAAYAGIRISARARAMAGKEGA